MAIKKRTKARRKRLIKAKPRYTLKKMPSLTREDIDRFGELILTGYGTREQAELYFEVDAKDHLYRLQSIAEIAESKRTWKHLEGCYGQAMMLYVFASTLYENHPEHLFLTDVAYDRLARWLLKHWSNLPRNFRTWYNVTAMGLEAGTALGTEPDRLIMRMISLHTDNPLEDIINAGLPDKPRVLRRKSKRVGGGKSRTVGRKTRRTLRKKTKR